MNHKRLLAQVTIFSILGLLAWGGWMGYEKLTKSPSAPKSAEGKNIDVQAKPANIEKSIKISQQLADRIAQHSHLPERSPLGLGLLGTSQTSNTASMQDLIQTLAEEIGATPALGALRTLQENRSRERNLQLQTESTDPATAQNAVSGLERIQKENQDLSLKIREALNKEGFDFTQEQVDALCALPTAEEMASMISAFGTLKIITAEMETRLRAFPTQETAQQYYGAYSVLLIALDRIQKDTIQRIENKHIPKTEEIQTEAHQTIAQAQALLRDNGVSINEANALQTNIGSCIKTLELAQITREKLGKNLEILRTANAKLGVSIQTAKNCHMTALLQKEVLQLDARHVREISQIEALIIPELAAVNFADPSRPSVSPARKPRM